MDAQEVDKYLPEGLAGEMSTEFQTTRQTSWMVRESGKVLCRLIDSYEGPDRPAALPKMSQNLVQPLNIPGLTDRKEWSNAQLSVKMYGKEMFDSNAGMSNGFEVTQGPGSRVDNCVQQVLLSNSGQVPQKVMLLGIVNN